jgi:hypothetical protein
MSQRSVSSVSEIKISSGNDEARRGGFTVMFADGKIRNVIRRFSPLQEPKALRELNDMRTKIINRLNLKEVVDEQE